MNPISGLLFLIGLFLIMFDKFVTLGIVLSVIGLLVFIINGYSQDKTNQNWREFSKNMEDCNDLDKE